MGSSVNWFASRPAGERGRGLGPADMGCCLWAKINGAEGEAGVKGGAGGGGGLKARRGVVVFINTAVSVRMRVGSCSSYLHA